MSHIVIYTDFDGTVTGKVGSTTVFSPFYQSLLAGYSVGKIQDYRQTPMKSREEVQQLFEEQFGLFNDSFDYTQNDTTMLMSADAVTFFHELLKKEQVTINIITRNRADYITALLSYQGFSEEEIKKITFDDSGYKFDAVNRDLNKLKEKPAYLYILDDDGKSDYPAMYQAAQLNSYKVDQIHGYNELPGQFKWSTYQKDILELLAIKEKTEEAIVEIDSEQHDAKETAASITAQDTPVATDLHLIEEDQSCIADASNDATKHEETKPFLSGAANKPIASDTSTYRNIKIAGTSATIGFAIGFTIGIILVATGVFAPFGAGVLGALALGGTFAACTGMLTGLGGYIAAVGTAPAPQTKNETNIAQEKSNKGSLSSLSNGKSAKPVSETDVEYFPNMFTDKVAKNTSTTDNLASSLDNEMNRPGR
jgi:hypothetical protein